MTVIPMVAYHQLYVAPAEVWPEFDVTSDDDLVQVMPDRRSLIVRTGIAMGPVRLTVDVVADADPGGEQWEEFADGVLELDGPLLLTAPTVDTGVLEPVVVPPEEGAYGFRLWCRGRAGHHDEVVEAPVESYLLQFHR